MAHRARPRPIWRRIPPAPYLSLATIRLISTQIKHDNTSRLSVAQGPARNVTDAQKERQMLSTTLQDGLSEYAIGEKIRTLRLKKRRGLGEPGRHTGLSPALLSKIERGLMFPTLPTL